MKRSNRKTIRRLLGLLCCLAITVSSLCVFIYYFPFHLPLLRSAPESGVRIPVADRMGKWGYINEKGKVVIPFIYSDAKPFDGHFAIVEEDGRKQFFIDRTGKRVSDKFAYVRPFDKSGLSVVSVNKKNKGFVNRSIETVIEPIWQVHRSLGFEQCDIKAELAYVVDKSSASGAEKHGMINRRGELVIPIVWDEIGTFYQGMAAVRRNEKWGLIDRNGKVLVQPKWDQIYLDSRDEPILVYHDDQMGAINAKGEILIPLDQWEVIRPFTEFGLAAAVNYQDKYGIIDTHGNNITNQLWDNAICLIGFDGVSMVKKGGKAGLINKHGKVIAEPEWDRIDLSRGNTNLIPVSKGDLWGLMNLQGDLVSPCQWNDIYWRMDNHCPAIVKKGDLWGLVDESGNIVVEPKWDSIRAIYFNNKHKLVPIEEFTWVFAVETGGKTGLIDDNGKVILQPSSQWTEIIGTHVFPSKEDLDQRFYQVKDTNDNWVIIDASGTIVFKSFWGRVLEEIVTENNRHWRVYYSKRISYKRRRENFYDTLNEQLTKFGLNEIQPPFGNNHYEVFDDQGKRIWQASPYSPLTFIIATAALVIMLPFLSIWVLKIRRSKQPLNS